MADLDHKELLKKVRRIQISTKHAVNDVFAGQYHSVFKGRGMEFDEVREYVPGDDIRSIDWNVTARTGTPHIKKFVEEREMTVMLVVDVSASHLFGSGKQMKRDLAAEVAAVLAFSAIRNNDRIGLILFAEEVEKYIPPKKGTRHVLRLVREMLTHQPQGKGTNAAPALDYLNHVSTRKNVTFLISDFMFSDEYEKLLKITARRHDLINVIIGDKHEIAWPGIGVVHWRDAETGEQILVDTSSRQARKTLGIEQTRRAGQIDEMHRKAGIDTIRLFAGEPYEKEFIKFFRQRASRR
ncbi:MAG: DUF58 domain-containing protein [Kiritimatiellales bacterium]|nr:DUF58 domain-containing protein [Kiritimatiellales bacterium]